MDYLATFAFYDEKGRRLNIFAEQVEAGLKISVITCSKDDQFCKKVGRALYMTWRSGITEVEGKKIDTNPQEFILTLKDSTKPQREFIQWCRDNFYSLGNMAISIEGFVQVLQKNGEVMDSDLKKTLKNIVKNGI